VQRSFLPSELPVVPGYQFFAAYEPALSVGGDYYNFTPLPDGRLAVAVGDVAGKGVPAALLTVKLASDARLCLSTEVSPAAAVRQLNELLCPFTRPTDRFVTLGLAVLDPASHTVTLASAGHLSPLLLCGADGALSDAIPREVAGVPLGLNPGVEYSSCPVSLQPGDTLILFSDGVPDATSTTGERFRMPGLRAAILAPGERTARRVGERVMQALRQHSLGQSAPFDDITLVCFSRLV
jgi:serine phosphatase RsbU (regulator of sigma subunit)